MTFWTRLSRSRLIVLSSFQSRSCYYVRNSSSSICQFESPILGPLFKQSCSSDRFIKLYSSSPEEKFKSNDTGGPLLNEQIQHQYVRLVSNEGHNVMPSWQALEMAKKLNLDLVLVDNEGTPPVCKIFDYKKTKYDKKIRDKEKIKNKATIRKGDCKEVRFSMKTELKDLKMKANQIKRLIEDGYRVKCVAMPLKHGRKQPATGEEVEEKIGEEMKSLFDTLSSLIEDEAIIECEPSMKSGQGHLIVRHKKFGPTKKGISNKSKENKASSRDVPVPEDHNERAPIVHHDAPQITNRYSNREVKQDQNAFLPFGPPISRATVSAGSEVSGENNRYARKPVVNGSERDQIIQNKDMRGYGFNRYGRAPGVNSSGSGDVVNRKELTSSEMNRYGRTSNVNVTQKECNNEMRSSEFNRYNRSRPS